MKKILFFYFCIFTINLKSQNLSSNGGFEVNNFTNNGWVPVSYSRGLNPPVPPIVQISPASQINPFLYQRNGVSFVNYSTNSILEWSIISNSNICHNNSNRCLKLGKDNEGWYGVEGIMKNHFVNKKNQFLFLELVI